MKNTSQIERIERRMGQPGLLQDSKRRLRRTFGKRLVGVVLYGSRARGKERPGSDVDLLVLLKGKIAVDRDLRACIRALSPLSEKTGLYLSARPTSAARYQENAYPLYWNVRREGVPL
ncbi:MAG: nucleotidyltransferase domain-containing protein [Bdellovibrionota bacterium]